MLEVTEKKIDFDTIFKEFAKKPQSSYSGYGYGCFGVGDYDDDIYGDVYGCGCWGDDDYDWWDEYESYKAKKNKKKKKEEPLVWDKDKGEFVKKSELTKNNKKRKRIVEDDNDEYDSNDKFIYFYKNMQSDDEKVTFKSLFEFDEFITNEDIDTDANTVQYLIENKLAHATFYTDRSGKKKLITANSHGNLVWEYWQKIDAEQYSVH